MIAGFIRPDKGSISIKGKVIDSLNPNERNVNTVFQNYALFPNMTVFENVAFPLRIKKTDKGTVEKEVLKYLELVGLKEHKDKMLPGYTHLQLAMPSSFGMWFGAYAEAITDDMEVLLAAYNSANKNPLGSAAGYGSTFPLDRQLTTDLLGFETLNYNAVFAQMSRGKTERNVAFAIAAVAGTLSKLAYDVVLYMNQNFGFISFPDELTTGSSIMPHKKNPDVFELVRGKCNVLQSLPNELMLLTSNLPSGYHRDLQLTKDVIFPAFNKIVDCINITTYMLSQVQVKEGLLDDEKYDVLFSVDAVNNLVVEGKPFRDAYKIVGGDIAEGKFKRPEQLNYQHLGSIGNLANDQIAQLMEMKLAQFSFDKVSSAIEELVR